ncbi:MAG: Unknown protein [uncultured Sulfurovum sp.]|uniref:Uncharacterized protein n=1 Tax=uncultured Sulfurovum sp. TaxID=269237 RepID=A0A6S6U1I3_9BACT|nr:MAG: Unknown protein [uncultured Sulfurovum sp.]
MDKNCPQKHNIKFIDFFKIKEEVGQNLPRRN